MLNECYLIQEKQALFAKIHSDKFLTLNEYQKKYFCAKLMHISDIAKYEIFYANSLLNNIKDEINKAELTL